MPSTVFDAIQRHGPCAVRLSHNACLSPNLFPFASTTTTNKVVGGTTYSNSQQQQQQAPAQALYVAEMSENGHVDMACAETRFCALMSFVLLTHLSYVTPKAHGTILRMSTIWQTRLTLLTDDSFKLPLDSIPSGPILVFR